MKKCVKWFLLVGILFCLLGTGIVTAGLMKGGASTNKVICGVCGGIGEYFGVDPTIVRLVWVLLACSGTGLLAYIIAAVVMPQEPDEME